MESELLHADKRKYGQTDRRNEANTRFWTSLKIVQLIIT